jgi:hypothetical protein
MASSPLPRSLRVSTPSGRGGFVTLLRLRIRMWLAWPFHLLGLNYLAYRIYGANAMQAQAMVRWLREKEDS